MVRKAEGCFIADGRDSARRRHVLRVGGHNSRHIGPYLQSLRSEGCGIERRAVVRTPSAEGADMSVLVPGYEARRYEHIHLGMAFHHLLYVVIGQRLVHDPAFGAHQVSGVNPKGVEPVAVKLFRQNACRKQFSESLAVSSVGLIEFVKQPSQGLINGIPLFTGEKTRCNGFVFLQQGSPNPVLVLSSGTESYQRVSASADCGADEYHLVFFHCLIDDVKHPRDSRCVCDGSAAEFQNLHKSLSVFFKFPAPRGNP